MIKILLAPAEIKLIGGKGNIFSKENFSFPQLFDKQQEVLNHYEKFIQNSTIEELSSWFGLKNLNEVQRYSQSLKNKPTMKAIQRYIGIAFDAIDYNNLNNTEQIYIDKNVLLFSNLFGVLKSSDLIPDYKYKQGSKLPNINLEQFYKEHLKYTLDNYLGNEIVDLRANYYNKYYKPSSPTITFKFLKDGKIVSHWAKHYRGLIVKTMAQNNIQNFTQLMNMPLVGLNLIEIIEKKNIKTLIMDIKH